MENNKYKIIYNPIGAVNIINVFDHPSSNGITIGYLKCGDIVNALMPECNGWLKINYNSKIGYILSVYNGHQTYDKLFNHHIEIDWENEKHKLEIERSRIENERRKMENEKQRIIEDQQRTMQKIINDKLIFERQNQSNDVKKQQLIKTYSKPFIKPVHKFHDKDNLKNINFDNYKVAGLRHLCMQHNIDISNCNYRNDYIKKLMAYKSKTSSNGSYK
jgi:hypothetical protein